MSQWERYYCPFCAQRGKTPDSKGKLYVNWSIRRFLCFRCDTRGHTSQLKEVVLTPYKGYLGSSSAKSTTWDVRRFIEYSIDEVKRKFPDVYSLLRRKHALHKFPKVKIAFFTTGIGLYLPLDGDQFQIRLFSDEEKAPKYLTQNGFQKVESSVGLDRLKSDIAVLVEGIFDYYRLEGFSVCMFGHFVSDKLVARLVSVGVRRLVVFLDDDSYSLAVETAHKIYTKQPFLDTYAAFCLDGSPADTQQLWQTPCLRVQDSSIHTLSELIGETEVQAFERRTKSV